VPFTVEDTTGRPCSRRAPPAPPVNSDPAHRRTGSTSRRFENPAATTSSAAAFASPVVRIDAARVRRRCATRLLYYMRQQRSGYNPTLKDSFTQRDGIIVDHPTRSR
jgi:hypothetical protein